MKLLRSASIFRLTRSRTAEAIGGAALLAALALLGAGSVLRAPADPAAQTEDAQINRAIEETMRIVLTHSPAPRTMEELEQAVEVVLPILYPAEALLLNPKSPAVLEAEADASRRLESAAAGSPELAKDQQFLQRRQAALESLGRGIDPDAKRKAILARLPEADAAR
jgi:hypothetical protein